MRDLPGSITTIVQAQSWHKLDEMRGQDYHRRRPNSAPLDTPSVGSAWTVQPGVTSMSVGGQPAEADGGAAELAAVMFEVERLLLGQMTVLRDGIIAAIDALIPSPEPRSETT